ncbi:aminoacyl-tRNA hydrolase [bacterium]|nr:aminoacyl-tRNA hydrolase [bacterium]
MERFLVVGLGNPGSEYEDTRHNIGFKVLEAFAEASGLFFATTRHGWAAEARLKGRSIRLQKPNTFMNLSGKAVRHHLQDLKLSNDRLLIVTDDLALPFGKLRLKPRGSDGGHNGLKSIEAELGTAEYPRLRVGIGSDFRKGGQVDYVLGSWNAEELAGMNPLLERSVQCIQSWILEGVERTMTRFNG